MMPNIGKSITVPAGPTGLFFQFGPFGDGDLLESVSVCPAAIPAGVIQLRGGLIAGKVGTIDVSLLETGLQFQSELAPIGLPNVAYPVLRQPVWMRFTPTFRFVLLNVQCTPGMPSVGLWVSVRPKYVGH